MSKSWLRLERVFAFQILRLFLGLRTLLAGLEKFESGGIYSFSNYSKTMGKMSEGITSASFLPLWATRSFAFPLGYVLVALGLALLLGIKPRMTLFATGLIYIGLSFGLMAVQEGEGTAWLGVYLGLIAAALMLSRHCRIALWPDRFTSLHEPDAE